MVSPSKSRHSATKQMCNRIGVELMEKRRQ
jgi:hypothetical protein